MVETTGNRMTTMRTTDKPFSVTKRQVYEPHKAVNFNHGADDPAQLEQIIKPAETVGDPGSWGRRRLPIPICPGGRNE